MFGRAGMPQTRPHPATDLGAMLRSALVSSACDWTAGANPVCGARFSALGANVATPAQCRGSQGFSTSPRVPEP